MSQYVSIRLLTMLLLFTSIESMAMEPADTSDDRRQIAQLVKNYEDAWNKHDPAGLAANYTADATWVNWFGAMYTGRADIESHYQSAHSTYFKDTRYYTRSIEDVSFVKPDVAVAHVRTGLTGDSRYPGQVFEFRRTILLTKSDGKWLIYAGQNAKLGEGIK